MEPGEYRRMDQAEGVLWWYRALHARLLAALAPARGRLLDAGCGTGGFLQVVRQARPDLRAAGLDYAQAASLRASAKSAAPVVRGSVEAMPFAGAVFDAVVCADVLCHAAVEPRAALGEIARVLRPGGLLVVNMPAYEWLLSAHDRQVHNVRRSTASRLVALLSGPGFAQVRARYWNSLPLPAMILQRTLRRQAAASDVAPLAGWLDRTLFALTALERAWPFALPAGGSILATARRA